MFAVTAAKRTKRGEAKRAHQRGTRLPAGDRHHHGDPGEWRETFGEQGGAGLEVEQRQQDDESEKDRPCQIARSDPAQRRDAGDQQRGQ